MGNTKTLKRAQYKQELIDTLTASFGDLDWFQTSELIDKLDALTDQFVNI